MRVTSTTAGDFKIARPGELPLGMEILAEAAAALKERGPDQWPSPPNVQWQRWMPAALERGEGCTVGRAKHRFGSVRLAWSDACWPDDDLAGYRHVMAACPAAPGQQLGGLILNWTAKKATQAGKRHLRLDCLAALYEKAL